MWKVYPTEGIAVQSTVGRLVRCFDESKEDILIGEVQYSNYDKSPAPESDMRFDVITRKRMSFQHEQELRAVYVDARPDTFAPGVSIPVDLNTLIQCIYIAPKAPGHIKPMLEAVLDSFSYKYKATSPIHQSALYKDPLV